MKNKKLKDLVVKARNKEELEESKVLKENLSKALEEAKNDLESQLQDLRAKRDKVIWREYPKHRNILKKVSDLRMINENLNTACKDQG